MKEALSWPDFVPECPRATHASRAAELLSSMTFSVGLGIRQRGGRRLAVKPHWGSVAECERERDPVVVPPPTEYVRPGTILRSARGDRAMMRIPTRVWSLEPRHLPLSLWSLQT